MHGSLTRAMNPEIITALIAAGGGLLGSGIGVIASAKLTNFRLEQLEKKVDKHNNVIERMYRLEGEMEVHEEKIKVANHRIDDLEKR